MKRLSFLLLFVFAGFLSAQNTYKGDPRSATQNGIVKLDGSQNAFVKGESDGTTSASGANSPALGNENVTFNATPEGIYITIISGTNKIKLFALTGQVLLNGDLTQGHFFIPTRQGIYFLKVNNKSYKVICR